MKKRFFNILMSGLLMLGLTACGTSQKSTTNENTEPQTSSTARAEQSTEPQNADSSTGTDSGQAVDGKSLVVYFSMPETTNPENMNPEEEFSTVVIDGDVLGNTQYVAYIIQENTGADIFRIEPVTPYPMDHAELEEIVTEEKRNNAMPEIASEIEHLEQYDTIFLGYPNWYSDMPRIIYSFLEQYDLSGKTIIPFVTSGGSGFSNTIQTITEQEPDATVVTDGLSISRTEVQDAKQEIIQWVNELGYSK